MHHDTRVFARLSLGAFVDHSLPFFPRKNYRQASTETPRDQEALPMQVIDDRPFSLTLDTGLQSLVRRLFHVLLLFS